MALAHAAPSPFVSAASLCLLLAAGLLAIGSLALGVTAIPLADLPAILWGGERVHTIVVWEVRLPHVLAGALAGAGLDVAGAPLPDGLRNSLADPSLLGVAGGASFAVALVVALGLPAPPGALPVLALAGGLAAALLVLLAARLARDPRRVVLAGAALSALFAALVTIVVVLGSPQQVRLFATWRVGAGWEDVRALAPWLGGGLGAVLLLARPLALLALGDEVAEGLGLPVARARALILPAAVALVGPVVARCGPMAFVAPLAPHLARGLLRRAAPAAVLPASALLGAWLLVASDLARGRAAPASASRGRGCGCCWCPPS